MADRYVDSNAAGAGTGADWANAFTDRDTAYAAGSPGDTFWFAHDHITTVAVNDAISPPGTITAPCRSICVNKAGSVPPVAADLRTTAVFETTGNSDFDIAGGGFHYWYGIIWSIGSGVQSTGIQIGATTARFHYIFDNCLFDRPATAPTTGGGSITMGVSGGLGQRAEFINCTWKPGHSTDAMWIRGGIHSWRGGAVDVTRATPTALFDGSQAGLVATTMVIEGVDLSAIALLSREPTQATGFYVLKNCKTHASLGVTLPTSLVSHEQHVINCNNGAVNYDNQKHTSAGSLTTEATIVRTGGFSDGTTTTAWKIVTSARASQHMPFVSFPMQIWIEDLVETTVTVHGTWGGGAVPNNDDIWIEASYLGSAGSPIATIIHNGLQNRLEAEVALDADAGSTWGGGTTDFSMSLTFTPAMKGFVTIWAKAALASTTFYIDQLPVKT